MDPGDYATNVLSCSNFASVNYQYFEVRAVSPTAGKKQLLRLEAECRSEGTLVLCDPSQDGIWSFTTPSTISNVPTSKSDISSIADSLGIGLSEKEHGVLEQAGLVKSKQVTASSFSTPNSSTLSPSSSLDSALRNPQAANTRVLHQNATQGSNYEAPALSPGARTAGGSAELFLAQVRIYEHLISAVLGSIVFQLCRNSSFVPLNSRTLLLTLPQVSNPTPFNGARLRKSNEVLVATLDISVTSLGSLVVKAHSDFASNFRSLAGCLIADDPRGEMTHDAVLWLAPGGTAARYCGFVDERSNLATNPVSQPQDTMLTDRLISMNPTMVQSWKSTCLEWLNGKGINTSVVETDQWVFVQLLGGNPLYSSLEHHDASCPDDLALVAWPASLCFQTLTSATTHNKEMDIPQQQPRDPLDFAETWFSRKDERAEMLFKRQKERQDAEALSREQADVELRALQYRNSPVAMRRSSNAGAMYPTPPDALHHLIGVTPNFDGTVSTPGNPNMYPSNDTGNVVSSNPPPNDMDTDLWGSSEKKDRHGAPDAFNDNDNDNDNLFGDIEEGDFFGTDVTDADFSFFDQPDDPLPQVKHVSSTDDGAVVQENNHRDDGMSFEILNTDTSKDVNMEDFDSIMLAHALPAMLHLPVDVVPIQPQIEIKSHELKIEAESEDIFIKKAHPLPAISPRFDRETVFRQLLPNSAENTELRRASTFNKMDFENGITSVNQKYDVNGPFNFVSKKVTAPNFKDTGLPTTDYLSSRQKASRNKIQPLPTQIMMDDTPVLVRKSDAMDYTMDSDNSSQISDQDDASIIVEEPPHTHVGLKNIWNLDNDVNSVASPLENNITTDSENLANTPRSINDSHLLLLEADPADWPLTDYLVPCESDIQLIVMSDFERIATAQILADQAVSGTLKVSGILTESVQITRRCSSTRALILNLVNISKGCLEGLTTCTMRTFLEIQGIPVVQGLRLPPRPIPSQRGLSMSDLSRINNPFTIQPPQLELKRSDARISVLPSAVNFWDNLGLSPAKGTKDVVAVCVYPNIEGVALSANAFLDQMGSQYESFRLGTHDRIATKELADGLVPFAIEISAQNHKTHYLALLKETVGRLGRHLATHTADEKNLVVYFVYPNDNPQLLIHICSAFQHLFNLYRKALSEKKVGTTNELVLQLVPLDFIASPTALVVQPPSQYARLAMEVYDRCINFTSSSSSPAILLEQPLPKIIDFKLSINPSASLLQENTCLHIAYAQSIDDRWITAAWTDNRGTQQMTASYCLGRKNEPISTPFSDIALEIWQTTLDYIGNKKIHWRIMIVRIGVMDPSEVESWANLATMPTNNHTSLTLLTVKTDPSLCLLPPSITLPPNGNTSQSVLTPASTPQPSQSSIVDASTPTKESQNASTPVEASAELESDSCLVDYTDQSWGAVLGHRLNNSNSLLELSPALISGYLIKRGGTNLDDPPILMEVNIILSDVVGNPRTFHESLLREILGYYRGLGTLARVRGIVDPVTDCRPWHIAAAEKAVRALYVLM